MKVQLKFFTDYRKDAGILAYERCITLPSRVTRGSPRHAVHEDWFELPLDRGLV